VGIAGIWGITMLFKRSDAAQLESGSTEH